MTIPPPVATAFTRLLRLPPPPSPPPGDESTACVFRASPKFLQYRTALWAVKACLALGVLVVFAGICWIGLGQNSGPASLLRALSAALLILGVAMMSLTWTLLRIDYAWRWYVVTDRSLRVREGVWHVREMTVTFANIQNLSVEQGPLQRLFGIYDLRVDTAGGGGAHAHASGHGGVGLNLHSALLRGLDDPETVRTAIQQRLRGRADAGLGDPEDAEQATAGTADTWWAPDLVWAAADLLAEAKALSAAAMRLADPASPVPPSPITQLDESAAQAAP